MSTTSLSSLLQRFFTDRLLGQLGASPHTMAGYRDTFRLLLRFATATLKRAPSGLRIEDLDVAFLGKFLNHLESDRHNSPRTRNIRLSALHGFFRCVAISEPALALQCQRILTIPAKRAERRPVESLTDEECAVLVATPNPATWIGGRDRALLLVAIQTGLRNSEITALKHEDVKFGIGAHVRCLGKGSTPGCPKNLENPVIRSSRARGAGVSAPMPSSGSSRGTSRRPDEHVPRLPRSASRRTPCGTPRPWRCSVGVWISS